MTKKGAAAAATAQNKAKAKKEVQNGLVKLDDERNQEIKVSWTANSQNDGSANRALCTPFVATLIVIGLFDSVQRSLLDAAQSRTRPVLPAR